MYVYTHIYTYIYVYLTIRPNDSNSIALAPSCSKLPQVLEQSVPFVESTIHSYINTYMHIDICTYIHISVYTDMYIHIYICIYICILPFVPAIQIVFLFLQILEQSKPFAKGGFHKTTSAFVGDAHFRDFVMRMPSCQVRPC